MTSAAELHRIALGHLLDGDWEEALGAATFGLRHAPDDGRLHEAAGIAAYHRKEFGLALFHLESATTLVPLGVEPQLRIADLYLRSEQPEAARTVLQFLAEGDRCPSPPLPDLARCLGRAGLPTLALTVCQRLIALRPAYHPAWFGVAYYLRQLGRPAEQLVFPLRAAFQLAPASLPYRLSLAGVLIESGRPTEAYHLVAGIPPEAVPCGCQCRRFARACEAVGDAKRSEAFRERAVQLPCAAGDALGLGE